MPRLDVGIITPWHVANNPRVYKECITLAKAGHGVTLVQVRAKRILAEADDRLLAGTGVRRINAADFARFGPTSLWSRGIARMARSTVRGLEFETSFAIAGARALRRAALRIPKIDVWIVHGEAGLFSAVELLRRGAQVVTDIEDWHSENLLPRDRAYHPMRLIRSLETSVLPVSQLVTTTSRAMSRALETAYRLKRAPHVTYNVFPLVSEVSDHHAPSAGAPRFVWISQWIGPGRGLETAFEALARVTVPFRLTLVGRPEEVFVKSLLEKLPLSHRSSVELHSPIEAERILPFLSEHDIGLALEPGTPRNNDLTVSNKLFYYLNAGLAVIATETSGQREIAEAAPGAIRLVPRNDPSSLADAVEAWARAPQLIAEAGALARRAAREQFSWEREGPKWLAAFEAAVEKKENASP